MWVIMTTFCVRKRLTSYVAIGIFKPPDVRPILNAYHGKDIALEYAKKEAEMKSKHIEDWEKNKKGHLANSFTLSSLFGSSGQASVLFDSHDAQQ